MAQTRVKIVGEYSMFKNDDTRERWRWVQRAIGHAKTSSENDVRARSSEQPRPAASPFAD
jgi:hypothetical protein